MKFSRLVLVAVITAALLIMVGCDLFAPRKANDPDTPTPWNTFFINSSLTVQNLVFSYDYPQNALNFGDILSSNFVFHFAVQDINDYGTPAAWNADSEKEMLINLHKNISDKDEYMMLELTSIAAQPDQINASNAWIYRTYVIHVLGQNKEISIYSGRCALYLESENGFWKIREWNDYRTESNHSWGLLKYHQDNNDV